MKKKTRTDEVTRRDFIRTAAGVTVAGAIGGLPSPGAEDAGESTGRKKARSTVVLVRDEGALNDAGKPAGDVLRKMLDDGVTTLTGVEDPVEAWKTMFGPEDTVGIKSNVWRYLPTPPELEQAMVERLRQAGVAADRIGIDDRGVRSNPVFREATGLVNVRPMRTHHWSGVGSLIKNHIMFTESPPAWHDDSCADLAGMWDLPSIRGKTRLNVLVMLTPLFQSTGPHAYNRKYTWPYRGILVGYDPVATDATGLRILEARRREYFGRNEPFTVSPKHIRVAEEKFGLGVADPDRIDVVKLGWKEGILI
jgi:hypothetical protein